MIKLLIFDVDGTLAETYTLKLLPGVANFFQQYRGGECAHRPALAIATNQGGVGMRYWMETDGFGEPDKFPTKQAVDDRLDQLVQLMNVGVDISVYVSYRYQNRRGKWAPIPPGQEQNPRWRLEWRKPQAGMLRQAMADAGVLPAETLFVGDNDDDQGAAQAAGCKFACADKFFAQNWSSCEDFEAAFG